YEIVRPRTAARAYAREAATRLSATQRAGNRPARTVYSCTCRRRGQWAPASEPPAALVSADEPRALFFGYTGGAMAKEEGVEVEGLVTEVLPDRKYRVRLENGHEVLAYGAGKMSKYK